MEAIKAKRSGVHHSFRGIREDFLEEETFKQCKERLMSRGPGGTEHRADFVWETRVGQLD